MGFPGSTTGRSYYWWKVRQPVSQPVSQSVRVCGGVRFTAVPLPAVPVRLLSHSEPVYHRLNQNRPVSLSISFTGRVSHNLMVTWYHDNQALPTLDPRITTVQSDTDPSTSTLTFSLAQRSDGGVYRVEVVTMVGQNLPRRVEQTFQLDVTSKFDDHYLICTYRS